MDRDVAKELRRLSAKVTALEMLLETLFVDELTKDQDPAAIGEAMVNSAYEAEQKVRRSTSGYEMQITEAISAIMDGAVKRAIARRKNRPKGPTGSK